VDLHTLFCLLTSVCFLSSDGLIYSNSTSPKFVPPTFTSSNISPLLSPPSTQASCPHFLSRNEEGQISNLTSPGYYSRSALAFPLALRCDSSESLLRPRFLEIVCHFASILSFSTFEFTPFLFNPLNSQVEARNSSHCPAPVCRRRASSKRLTSQSVLYVCRCSFHTFSLSSREAL